MTASETPTSTAEQKRARRHKVARRLYEALVAQDPNQLIVLHDGAGKVVARHNSVPEHGVSEIAALTLPTRPSFEPWEAAAACTRDGCPSR